MKYLALVLVLFTLVACGTQTGDLLTFRSADPSVSVAFRLLPAPPDVVVPQVTPDPVAVELEETEAGQQDCLIKLNIGRNNERLYHVPFGAYYDRVRVDLERGEGYACTEEEAIEKGYRKSSR